MFKTSDGCSISYNVHPSPRAGAPRLALIHSLALDGSIWDGVVKRLSNDAEILTYDCRGHGKSSRAAGPYTTELFAKDLGELLDHLGWTRLTVAGCSMGGCIAQTFAGLNPARVNSLGLIDTTAWYGEDAPKAWRERAENAKSKGLGGLIDFQVTRWFSDGFRTNNPELVNTTTKIFLSNDLQCYAATCVMLGDADLRHYAPALRMPVGILVGEEDYATPVAMAQKLHESIKHSTLTVLSGGRHLTPIQCPDEIAAHIRALLVRTS